MKLPCLERHYSIWFSCVGSLASVFLRAIKSRVQAQHIRPPPHNLKLFTDLSPGRETPHFFVRKGPGPGAAELCCSKAGLRV